MDLGNYGWTLDDSASFVTTTGVSASTTLTGGSLSMATSAAYDATGNRLTSVTDSAGSTVSYGYSSGNSTMWGLPTSVTAPNGTVTTTAYDAYGRVTQNSIANTASVGYTYSNGMLSSLQRTAGSNTLTYNFTYDSFGNTTSIKVGSTALASYTYGAKNGLLTSMTYGNNATVTYTYDTLGRIKTETYADGRVVSYTYTGDGQLYSAKETKGSTSTLYIYTYDTLGRLVGSQQIKDGTIELRTEQTYNASNQLTKQAWQVGNASYSETYTYNASDGSLATHGTATGQTVSYSYDALRRISGVSTGVTTKQYTYRSLGNNRTTAQVASVSYPNLVTPLTFGYTYDAMGNIATYSDTGKGDVTYTYDAQGQLLKAEGDVTYTYTYDAAGNVLTASNGTVTHSYTYGNTNWRDLLTAFDGETISYDAIGNPTSYYNGTRWSFSWSNGRQLTSASNGTNNITYTYTADGMRTSKVVDGVIYNYYYASGKLLRQTWGDNTLDFFYDAQGYPYAMKYNGTPYYYVTNLQGNVERVVNSSGSVVAYYGYDPYGRITGTVGDLAEINPLRYRGYVYDTETGLYYLQSRYYDPTTGRFINADAYASTGQGFIGNNMFAYCLNNPLNHTDPSGESAVAEGLKTGLWILPFLDGPIPFGDIIAAIGFLGFFLYEQSQTEDVITNITANEIDWGAGGENRKNHILKGTKGKHRNGWKRFGIDPDNNNAWGLILPLLKEVVDKADYYTTTTLSGGGMYIQYFKTYIDQGVQVVVKIWVDATGTIQQISDAIPYIID